MKTRAEVLNYLIDKYNLESYLEIGSQKKVNFGQIEAKVKTCVDPDPKAKADYVMTSDEYFKSERLKYDLIFIDGLHHKKQVRRDFENALKVLNDGGFIMLHDTWPEEEIHTRVPRVTQVWNGDVYKFACELNNYSDIDFCTFTFDHGCTVIWKKEGATHLTLNEDVHWQWFLQNRYVVLRVYNNTL